MNPRFKSRSFANFALAIGEACEEFDVRIDHSRWPLELQLEKISISSHFVVPLRRVLSVRNRLVCAPPLVRTLKSYEAAAENFASIGYLLAEDFSLKGFGPHRFAWQFAWERLLDFGIPEKKEEFAERVRLLMARDYLSTVQKNYPTTCRYQPNDWTFVWAMEKYGPVIRMPRKGDFFGLNDDASAEFPIPKQNRGRPRKVDDKRRVKPRIV